jgi:hypothetical protein
MTVILFCGPTLSRVDVQREMAAEVRAPAARGDLLRAAMSKPAAIGLVDGYFDRVPAVWHKEVLWAMSEGIHVFGAASMGALRAAELCSFGMCGVGAIFESYRDGTLTDDDEVAVAHASSEQEYRSVSDAMVNIRATLARAERETVIAPDTRERLEALAKGLHYPDRSYAALTVCAERTKLPRAEIEAFAAWLPTGRVDQKREDALAMLRHMAEEGRRGWTAKRVTFTFSQTDAWETLRAEVSGNVHADDPAHSSSASCREVAEELLVAGRAPQDHRAAVARGASLELARRAGMALDPRAVQAATEEFRRERGLFEPASFDAWLRDQRLGEAEVVGYFRSEAIIRAVQATLDQGLSAHLVDHLRAVGVFGSIATRAQAKRDALSALGLEHPELRDARLTESELWSWYFVEKLQRDVPVDIKRYAGDQQTTLDDLRSAAVREYLFLRLSSTTAKL